MNRYDLLVRNETIHIEFRRINDSRRLKHYVGSIEKNPNLFHIRGAMACRVDMPRSICPEWAQKYGDAFHFSGLAFCWHRDQWSARKGRHRSLAEALAYPNHDDNLNAEIVQAFTLAESARTKVKGPARVPKTAKTKTQRKSTLERIADALEKLSVTPYAGSGFGSREIYVPLEVRPADTLDKGE